MAQAQVQAPAYREVDAATLKAWLDRGEAVVVDVREPAEYAAGHLAGSMLLPASQFDLAQLPARRGEQHLVVHCASGMRASTVCEKIVAAGEDVWLFRPGVKGWEAAGYPVEGTGKEPLSVQRQTQLAVGVMVLAGTLLGFLVSPGFFALPAMAGFGLVGAGLTGKCPLALVIARLPHNQRCPDGTCGG